MVYAIYRQRALVLVPNNTRFHAIIISLVIFIFEALHFLGFRGLTSNLKNVVPRKLVYIRY